MTEPIPEEFWPPFQPTDQLASIGINKQFVRIKAVSSVRLVGAVDPVTIHGSGTRRGEIAVPNFVGIFRKFYPFEFRFACIIEQAKFDFGGIRREQSEVHSKPIPRGSKGKRSSFRYRRTPGKRYRFDGPLAARFGHFRS